MKIKVNLIIICIISSVCLISCNNDDDSCSNERVEFRNIEDVSNCQETLWDLTLNTVEDYLIIRNQEEFEQFVIAQNCTIEIDFTRYDLIIGSHYISPEASFDYEVINNCEENYLYVFVKLLNNQPSEIENKAVYHVLVPKLENGQTVQINFGT